MLEEGKLGGVVNQRLGVPLNSQQEWPSPSLDALDDAVVRPRNRAQAAAEPIDALMVKGVDNHTATTNHCREATAGGDADLVRDLVPGLALTVGNRAVRDLRQVLVQGAAARDVERLRTAADAEDRQPTRVGLPRQLHLESVELRLGGAQLGVSDAPVGSRVEVGPTGEQHAAETVEQGRDSIQLERWEHDRQSTCALDGTQIGHPECHLDPSGLATPVATHLAGVAQLRRRHTDQSRTVIVRRRARVR